MRMTDENCRYRKVPTCILYEQASPEAEARVLAWGLEAKNANVGPGLVKYAAPLLESLTLTLAGANGSSSSYPPSPCVTGVGTLVFQLSRTARSPST